MWYLISVLIFMIGISAFVMLLINGISSMTNGSQQIVVPGRSDVFLSESGKYTIFYEYRSVVDGKVYLTDGNLSGLECTLKDKASDQYIQITTPSISSNYSLGGRAGVSVLGFTITRPGTYELSAQYSKGKEGQEVVLAIGKGFGGKILATVIVGIVVLIFAIAFSVAVFVITLRKRRSAMAKRT